MTTINHMFYLFEMNEINPSMKGNTKKIENKSRRERILRK